MFPLDSGCTTCRAIEYRICVMQRVHGSKEAGHCLVLVFAEVDPHQHSVQSQQAKYRSYQCSAINVLHNHSALLSAMAIFNDLAVELQEAIWKLVLPASRGVHWIEIDGIPHKPDFIRDSIRMTHGANSISCLRKMSTISGEKTQSSTIALGPTSTNYRAPSFAISLPPFRLYLGSQDQKKTAKCCEAILSMR